MGGGGLTFTQVQNVSNVLAYVGITYGTPRAFCTVQGARVDSTVTHSADGIGLIVNSSVLGVDDLDWDAQHKGGLVIAHKLNQKWFCFICLCVVFLN